MLFHILFIGNFDWMAPSYLPSTTYPPMTYGHCLAHVVRVILKLQVLVSIQGGAVYFDLASNILNFYIRKLCV